MENVYQKIGKLLKEWRESQGFSLYKVAKEGSGKARYDYLKRFENGEGVNASTMTCYLDFCYEHGFRVFEELYNQIQVQPNTVVEDEQICEAKEESVEEVPTHPEEEETIFDEEENISSEEEEYRYAEISFDNKEKMNECDQIAFIRHHRCPRCGSELIEKSGQYGPYIGCAKFFDRINKCDYTASGTFASFTLSNKFKNGVTPTTQKEEVADSSPMEG